MIAEMLMKPSVLLLIFISLQFSLEHNSSSLPVYWDRGETGNQTDMTPLLNRLGIITCDTGKCPEDTWQSSC